MKKIIISKHLLTSLYVDDKKTLKEIAIELGVSRQTVANKLKEFDIEIRPNCMKPKSTNIKAPKVTKLKPYMDYDTFNRAYQELKSLNLVAEHFGVSIDTAYKWKSKLGIETVSKFSEIGICKINAGKPYTDKAKLEEYYDKYSIYDLAKIWDCNPTTISKWLRKFNIPAKSYKEQWARKNKNGTLVVAPDEFRLSEYLNTYKNSDRMSKRVVLKIKDIVGACQSCGETEVLDLHHIDENRRNNLPSNHVILCPNCHARIHRLGKTVSELCPNYVSWDKILDNGGTKDGR